MPAATDDYTTVRQLISTLVIVTHGAITTTVQNNSPCEINTSAYSTQCNEATLCSHCKNYM